MDKVAGGGGKIARREYGVRQVCEHMVAEFKWITGSETLDQDE